METIRQELKQEQLPSIDIIGRSPASEALRRFAWRASSSGITLLLLGETGVGKDHLAEYIHRLGRGKNFVPIDCGAIPDALIESELFGHSRGAFTGAISDKIGLIQNADGGTLFLNEVANLSFELQGKLLRFVEGRSFRPLGNIKEIPVNTRIIAATNVNLEEAVRKRAFREDLYYRLNSVSYRIPPLRERKGDVRLLAEHFLTQSEGHHSLSEAAFQALEKYEWPGNIRELKMVINHGLFYAEKGVITEQHIGERLRGSRSDSPFSNGDRPIPFAEMEKHYLNHLFEWTQGNLPKAVQLSGINRRRLSYRLEKLGLRNLHQGRRK